MNSIYKQMNEIDDNKSLDEKWNVKNQQELKKLKENFTVRQYSLNWDGEYEWENEESFNTVDEAQIRFNELKEVIDNGEFDYAAIALVDENDNEISIYGEPERQKVTKEDVIEYLRAIEEVSLTDKEFDYVVEDLWDAISMEMREGSIYETIDDVNMVELIDASDNPTHDLCYKLMGMLEDEDELEESLILTEAPIGSNDGSELSTAHDAKVVYETVRHIVDNMNDEEYPNPMTEAINHVKRNLKVDIEKNAAHWGYNNVSIKQLISNYTKAIKLIEDNFDGVTKQVTQLRTLLKQLQDTYNNSKR